MTDPPVLIVSPRDDVTFRRLADSLVADGAASPGALEQALRQRYPRTVVRARELSGERLTVWYVYREGRWIGRQESAPVERDASMADVGATDVAREARDG